jgi:hypothetical protein
MENHFQLRWDIQKLAEAFSVKEDDIREYLTDGRRVSFIIERRLIWENFKWELAKSEGAGYDLIDPSGDKWEVRSITSRGVYFNPSNQVGSGRQFNEAGFLNKLYGLKGFILSDITTFPIVEVYKVPVENVRRWYHEGSLGVNAKVSRDRFLTKLLDTIQY